MVIDTINFITFILHNANVIVVTITFGNDCAPGHGADLLGC